LPETNPSLRPRSIGARIKYARKTNGLSQADLAKRVGVSQPAIANWETGLHDPRRLMLAKLADILDTPLEWLAAGARSAIEADKHAAAAYLRRAVHHVPVISFENAARFAADLSADPHAMAEDYIPVTAGGLKFFALFVTDDAMNRAFPRDTLVVVDYADRAPAHGAFCLIQQDKTPILRRWNSDTDCFETYSSDPSLADGKTLGGGAIIGRARVSIRFH